MRFALRSALAVAALVVVALPASAGMVIFNGLGGQPIPPYINKFESQLNANGADSLYSLGADAKFTQAGTFKIYYHGAESSYVNNFQVNGNILKSENDENWHSELIGQFYANAGDTFSSLALAFGSNVGPFSGAGSQGFGIFYNSSLGGNGVDYTTLFVGYDDDGANLDDNHDDMLISIVFSAGNFSAVPEPASMAVWGLGALGLCIARRRQKAAKA